jgi:hypothetical protein
MLLKFQDSYDKSIKQGFLLVSKIHLRIAEKEAFMGNNKSIDKLYAQALVISAIIDTLINDDNMNPIGNENFLQELNTLLNLNY